MNMYYFKIAIGLFLGLHSGHPGSRTSLPQYSNADLKREILKLFDAFFERQCHLSRPRIRERQLKMDPDPQNCREIISISCIGEKHVNLMKAKLHKTDSIVETCYASYGILLIPKILYYFGTR